MRGCNTNIILDVHLCVNQPSRYVTPLANAGASRLIFQYEAMNSVENAMIPSVVNQVIRRDHANEAKMVRTYPNLDIEAFVPPRNSLLFG